jgi:adenylate cyclase
VLNALRVGRHQAPLSLSIGIHGGDVPAGTVGAADDHGYTVIGDAVNVGSREQQIRKERATRQAPSPTLRARGP